MDGLRHGSGDQALQRRRPAERQESRSRSPSLRSRSGCRSSLPRRRSSGLPRPASCSPPCPGCGRAASRSRSRTSGDAVTRPAPTARRSPARPPRSYQPVTARRRPLAQGHRDRHLRGGDRDRHDHVSDGRRHPAGTSPGARPTNLKPPSDPRHGPGRPDPDELGRDLDGRRRRSSRIAGGAATRAARPASRSRTPPAPHRTLTPDDIGSTLSLVVTATGKGGAASATTARDRRRRVRSAAAGLDRDARPCAGHRRQPPDRRRPRDRDLAARSGAGRQDRLAHRLQPARSRCRAPRSPSRCRGCRRRDSGGRSTYGTRQPQPDRTVLGYSTDGKVYHSVPPLQPASFRPGRPSAGTSTGATSPTS